MGKSYKGGYLHLSNKFNSHIKKDFQKSRRKNKKINCQSEVKSWNNDCCDNNSVLTRNVARLRANTFKSYMAHPYKIGYSMNTHVTFDKIVGYVYAGSRFGNSDTSSGIPEEFKLSSIKEQLDMLSQELKNLGREDEYLQHVNRLRKQLKRREAIGYFRGHNKNKQFI